MHRRVARPLARLGAEVRGATAEGAARPVTVAGPPRSPRSPAGSTSSRSPSGASRRPTGSSSTAARCRCGCTTSRRARILEANDAAVDGLRLHPRGAAGDDRRRARAVADGEHVRKDGTTIEVSVASHAIDFRGREACVVIAEDVTEKERLRVQLQQSQRLESLGQLAGGVAHDFNNLLAVILGYASFIERRAGAGQPATSATSSQIRKAGERADAAHPPAARLRPPRGRPAEVLDLTGVVLEMEQLLRRTLGEHVVLQHRAGAGPVAVMADHGQLEQVLVNLAVNARDAMPDGGTLTLDTENIDVDDAYASTQARACTPGRYVRLRVSDTGVGMDARRRRARVRAVLHHQAQGRGHRARPGDDLRHRHPGRRARADLLRARPRHDVHGPAARRPTRRCRQPSAAPPRPAPRRRRDDPRRRGRAGDARGDPPDPRRSNGYEVLRRAPRARGAPARRASTTARSTCCSPTW